MLYIVRKEVNNGRLWKWHIKWCPGWKAYIASLSDANKEKTLNKYGKR